jgi:hypothetical protein
MTGADNLLQANTDPQWLQEIEDKTDQPDNCKIYIIYHVICTVSIRQYAL